MQEDQAQGTMQWHNERLEAANTEVRRLLAELDAALLRRDRVRVARIHFMRHVAPKKQYGITPELSRPAPVAE